MRLAATLKLGYYPLPLTEAERLRKFLVYPAQAFAALDPCTGEGTALVTLTEQAEGYRYGIELDTYRATQARAVTNETIHGSCFYTQCPVEASSLVYCNPPYSSDWSETHTRRMEVLFIEHTYRWLKTGGVLVLVIPGARLAECSTILASHFRDTRFYRSPHLRVCVTSRWLCLASAAATGNGRSCVTRIYRMAVRPRPRTPADGYWPAHQRRPVCCVRNRSKTRCAN